MMFYAVFISSVLHASSLSILESLFFVYLGKISYGFYLIHYPVLMFFVKKVDAALPVKFVSTFLVTLALSHISLYLFEKRSEEHTSELQSLMRISYAVFCLKKKTHN